MRRDTESFHSILFSIKSPEPEPVEISPFIVEDEGTLFHQNFIEFTEKYIQDPYHNTANTLNNVLHKNCRLSEQLKSLASIYLMLENDLMHSFCYALFKQMDNHEPWFDKRILNSTFLEACRLSGYDEIVYIQIVQPDETNSPKTLASYLDLIEFKVEVKRK